jgi:hypothetical protein
MGPVVPTVARKSAKRRDWRHGGRRETRSCFGVSRLPFLPWGVPPVSPRGQADAQRGQSVGSTVSSEWRALDGFARRRNTIVSACIGFSEDLFRLRRRIVAPFLPLSGRRGSARLCTRFGSCSSRMPFGLPDCFAHPPRAPTRSSSSVIRCVTGRGRTASGSEAPRRAGIGESSEACSPAVVPRPRYLRHGDE